MHSDEFRSCAIHFLSLYSPNEGGNNGAIEREPPFRIEEISLIAWFELAPLPGHRKTKAALITSAAIQVK